MADVEIIRVKYAPYPVPFDQSPIVTQIFENIDNARLCISVDLISLIKWEYFCNDSLI